MGTFQSFPKPVPDGKKSPYVAPELFKRINQMGIKSYMRTCAVDNEGNWLAPTHWDPDGTNYYCMVYAKFPNKAVTRLYMLQRTGTSYSPYGCDIDEAEDQAICSVTSNNAAVHPLSSLVKVTSWKNGVYTLIVSNVSFSVAFFFLHKKKFYCLTGTNPVTLKRVNFDSLPLASMDVGLDLSVSLTGSAKFMYFDKENELIVCQNTNGKSVLIFDLSGNLLQTISPPLLAGLTSEWGDGKVLKYGGFYYVAVYTNTATMYLLKIDIATRSLSAERLQTYQASTFVNGMFMTPGDTDYIYGNFGHDTYRFLTSTLQDFNNAALTDAQKPSRFNTAQSITGTPQREYAKSNNEKFLFYGWDQDYIDGGIGNCYQLHSQRISL